MSAYFITASGTGIGKTFTTCALIHALREKGKNVAAYKPVISGFTAEDNTTDTVTIRAALNDSSMEEVSPWRFTNPLSPDMASAKEGRQLSLSELAEWTVKIKKGTEAVLIETVGGLMVPINAQHTTRDWMVTGNIPLVMVTGSYLGAISHTLTTLAAAKAAKLRVVALVVNESEGSTVDLAATRDSIANHARDIPLIIAQPRVSSPQAATVIHSLVEHLWN
jgi:dethiobiotin synthetase